MRATAGATLTGVLPRTSPRELGMPDPKQPPMQPMRSGSAGVLQLPVHSGSVTRLGCDPLGCGVRAVCRANSGRETNSGCWLWAERLVACPPGVPLAPSLLGDARRRAAHPCEHGLNECLNSRQCAQLRVGTLGFTLRRRGLNSRSATPSNASIVGGTHGGAGGEAL